MNPHPKVTPEPPVWIDRLLNRICAPHLREEVLGDLHERYYLRAERLGPKRARALYRRDVLAYLRPSVIRRKPNPEPSTHFANPDMLRNYLLVAWRNLIHNKTFSAINLLGLALGMACSLLIYLWIQDEYRMDAYHANGPHLYHVLERQFYDGKVEVGSGTPGLLPDELKKQFPEIAAAAGLSWEEQHTFLVGNRFNKEKGRFAGADWFRMYSVPLLQGTAETALDGPNNVAISRKLARNYFGSPEAALGKSVRLDNKTDYRVSAVFEDLPENSSLRYDFLLTWPDFIARNEWLKEWGTNVIETHLLLRPEGGEEAAARLEVNLKSFLKSRSKSLQTGNFDIQLFLQKHQDAYLYSNFRNGYPDGGRIEYVRLFGIVAVLILVIACINFMNLATARSAKRAREVGVRKVVGAVRGLLIGQFLGETLLLTLMALGIAVGLTWLLLPTFNSLTDKHISLGITSPAFWGTLLAMTVLTGLLAGSYPAFFLSSFHPIRVLKGAIRFGSGARFFRQGLVVFQFVLSMLLIVGTMVVYRQIEYTQTKNLGYDRENLIYLQAEGDLGTKYETFREQLLRMPGIQTLTYMDGTPTHRHGSTGNVQWPGKDPNASIQFQFSTVDYDFTKTLKLKLKGRDFSREYGMDSVSFLINETAARRIGYREPLGKPLTMWGQAGTIIGVMEDFHAGSLHQPIEPTIVRLSTKAAGKNIIVRTQPGQTREALASLETVYRQVNPKFPFAYQFADEEYRKLYHSEQVVGRLANYFAFLAIFISCLGLFGLSAFTAEQRTKEIGVRKVLGASVFGIVSLLSKDFLRLVLIAILIACPLAWYAMSRWLQDFAYKTDLEWWLFAGAGAIAVGIAVLTISFQSIKAALLNPVKSLRSE
ncbi:ABC transporter permease [Larkinella soli]|uniref:ABC transporter permease n=1 Tax=Larkinella soli TaxID=1770527 RepID=UPI001E626AB7|nr:ABC transporter permease [Larkinella soli]